MSQISELTCRRLEKYAKQQLSECKDKVFEYEIILGDHEPYVSGNCSIIDITYDRTINCDIYCIKDLESGSTYIIDFFHILLKEKKG